MKQGHGLFSRDLTHWPAGGHRYIPTAEKIGHFQALQGVLDSNFPPFLLGFNPGWEVGVSDCKQGKAVQVGNFEALIID
jgi:hypothetical protein